MKLQKNSSLALCSILEAASDPTRQISAADIAAKFGVSPHHLGKVLRQLGRAGMVESARGVGGGYRFSGNARRLTLMDVIDLFESVAAKPAESGGKEYTTDVGRAIARVLSEIDETATATFRSISIDTMLKLIERERRARETRS
jgi:Rrf2 family protein